ASRPSSPGLTRGPSLVGGLSPRGQPIAEAPAGGRVTPGHDGGTSVSAETCGPSTAVIPVLTRGPGKAGSALRSVKDPGGEPKSPPYARDRAATRASICRLLATTTLPGSSFSARRKLLC